MNLLRRNHIALLLFVSVSLAGRVESGTGVRVGARFPSLQLKNFQGQSVPLAVPETGLAVIQVWATWCAPCHELIPILVQLAAGTTGRRVHVALWNIDEQREQAWSYLQQQGAVAAGVDVFFDPGGHKFAQLGAPGMPVVFLIENGFVREVLTGASAEVRQRLYAHVGPQANPQSAQPAKAP